MEPIGCAGGFPGFRNGHGTASGPGWSPKGGVAWLVDRRLSASKGIFKHTDDSQVLTIWCHDWLLINFYGPPQGSHNDPQLDVCHLLVDVFAEISLDSLINGWPLGTPMKFPGRVVFKLSWKLIRVLFFSLAFPPASKETVKLIGGSLTPPLGVKVWVLKKWFLVIIKWFVLCLLGSSLTFLMGILRKLSIGLNLIKSPCLIGGNHFKRLGFSGIIYPPIGMPLGFKSPGIFS